MVLQKLKKSVQLSSQFSLFTADVLVKNEVKDLREVLLLPRQPRICQQLIHLLH